jgi:hypothetical protein
MLALCHYMRQPLVGKKRAQGREIGHDRRPYLAGSVTKRLLLSHGPACVQRATPCCAPRDAHTRPTVPPLLYSRPAFIGMLGQECTATFLLRFRAMFVRQRIAHHDHRANSSFGCRRQDLRDFVWTPHGEGADLQAHLPGGGLCRFCLQRRAGIQATLLLDSRVVACEDGVY